jgi:hypothetical protein
VMPRVVPRIALSLAILFSRRRCSLCNIANFESPVEQLKVTG